MTSHILTLIRHLLPKPREPLPFVIVRRRGKLIAITRACDPKDLAGSMELEG